MTGKRRRITAALAAASLLTATVTALGGGPAQAKTVFSTQCKHAPDNSEWDAVVYDQTGRYIGEAFFDSDPVGGAPDDSLYATDAYGDGWGIVAHLSTGRTASTAGHAAPYTTPAISGDLPEQQPYLLWAELVKGDESVILPSCPAWS